MLIGYLVFLFVIFIWFFCLYYIGFNFVIKIHMPMYKRTVNPLFAECQTFLLFLYPGFVCHIFLSYKSFIFYIDKYVFFSPSTASRFLMLIRQSNSRLPFWHPNVSLINWTFIFTMNQKNFQRSQPCCFCPFRSTLSVHGL